MMEQVEDTIAEQSTIDERGKGGWWWQSQSHRLMGGTLTTSRDGQEREAVARREAKVDNEASIGSNKDILDILAISHKMTMETLDKQLELEKLQQSNIKTQTNIQINDTGSNYSNLINKLVNNQL